MDFHFTSCLYVGVGNTCCRRLASEDCAYETVVWGRDGLVREVRMGEDDEKGRFNEFRVVLRLFPKVLSSRGGVFIGDCRFKELRYGRVPSSSYVLLRANRPDAPCSMAIG